MMKQKSKNNFNLAYKKIEVTITAFVLILAYAIFAFFAGNVPVAEATVPFVINFQGKLTKVSDGTNVSNAAYAFRFKLYDDPTAGSLLWTETFDQPSGACGKLSVTNGVFNSKLGSCNSLSAVDFSGGAVYLSVDFAPTGTSYDGEMSPRKQLLSAAYALVANGVNGTGGIKNTISSATALAIAKAGTDYALQVDTSAGSAVTGLKVTSAAAAGGLALSTLSTATDEALTINSKGAGQINLGSASTGNINIGSSGTGDILLGGGSGTTGCTVTNSTGALACAAGITAISGGLTATAGDVAITAGNLTVNSITRISNTGVGTFITGTVIGSQTFTTNNIADSGALTIASGAASALTLNSGTTGDLNIGTDTSAENIYLGTGAGAKTLLVGSTNSTSTTTIQSGSGDITLQARGSGTSGIVNIGEAGTTPDILVVGTKTTAGNPTGTDGGIYYNSNAGKLYIQEGGSWKEVCNKTDAACGAGSGSAWSALSSPASNLSLAMAEYTTGLTWDTAATAAAADYFTLSVTNDAGTDANTQRLLVLQNNDSTGSTTTERLLVLNNADVNELVTTALEITSAAGAVTNAIDVSDSDIVNALVAGANDLSGTNWSITGSSGAAVFVGVNSGTGLIQGTGGLTITGAAVSLNASSNFDVNIATGTSTGTITLGGTGAQSILIGSGVGVKTITIGNSNDDTFSLASSGLNVTSGGALTGVASIDTINVSSTALTFTSTAPTISVSTAATNLNIDAGTSGAINIAGTSSGSINFAGGAGSTGCTITTAGALTCDGAGSFSNFSGTNTGDVTLTAFGSSANANGASLSGQALTLQPASASFPGGVSTTTQSFAGDKTFVNNTTFTGSATHNGVSTFNTDADFVFADTENIALTSTVTATNAVDLFTSTLTNQTSSGTQRGIVLTNANDAANAVTENLILIDNAETTASTLTDAILITSSGVNDGITDAIDASAGNITNAINIGANAIAGTNFSVTGAGAVTAVGVNSGTGLIQGTGGLTITGAAVSLNASSNFDVNIATGTSTGTINLGGTGVQSIEIGSGVGVKTITIGNSNDDTFSINSSAFTVSTSGAVTGVTTLSASNQITSTLSTGTAPFVVASTTNVANLNASSLNGATFAAPGAIGSGTPGTGAFTTLTSNGNTTLGTGSSLTNTFGSGASSINTIGSATTPGTLTLLGSTIVAGSANTTAFTLGNVTTNPTFSLLGTGLTTLGGNLTVTGTSWTATPTISGLITATSGLTSNGTLTVSGGQNLTMASGAGVFAQTSTSTTTDTRTLSATALTTGKAETITLGSALTTGGGLFISGASYNHDAANIGSVQSTAFSDVTSGAFASTTNGALISPTINITAGAATKTINAISIAPTFTACTTATCNVQGLNIANVTDSGNFTSSALKLGTGWDTLISGTTAGTNLIDFTNFSVSTAGLITAATTTNTINGAIINGSTQTFSANNIADSGALTIATGANGALTLNPNGTGATVLTLDSVGAASGINDLQINRSGTLSAADSAADVLFNRTIVTGANADSATAFQLTSNINSTSGSDSGSVLGVTQSNASATGATIAISNAGSGNDITGSGSTWSITKAGALTVASCSGCTGSVTLQSAYNATSGNTITTTDARNIAFTFTDTTTDQSLTLTQQGAATASIFNDTNAGTNNAIDIQSGGVSKLTINELGTVSTSGNISTTGSGTITSAGLLTGSAGLTVTGAAVSLNDSSNFGVSLAGGSSTGTITLGGTGTQAIDIGAGVAAKTITIGNANDDTFSINSSGLDVSTAGALSGITGYTQGSGTMSLTSANTTQTTTSSIFALTGNSLTSGTGAYLSSNSITGGSLVNLNQLTSTFAGTGLLMNFANTAGTFSGNFVDFQSNSVSKFSVASTGAITSATLATGGASQCLQATSAGLIQLTGSACGAGAPTWNSIIVPTGDLTLAMDADLTTFNWDTLTTQNAWTMGSTSITTGKLLNVASTSNAYTTGNISNVSLTQAAATGTSVSGNISSVAFSPTYSTAITTPAISGNTLNIGRTAVTNTSFVSTLTVSGALARFSDSATQTTGTLTSTANAVEILQNYASNSGSALNVTTAGSGSAIRINDDGTLTDSTPVLVDASGQLAVGNTSPGALLGVGSSAQLTVNTSGTLSTSGNISTTGSGTITSAGLLTGSAGLTVSGAAANINATGTNLTNIGNSTGVLTIASGGSSGWTNTSGNLAFATASSGNITFAPASTGSVQMTSGVTTGTGTSSGLSLVANSLTTGQGVSVSSSTLQSGSLVDFTVTGTAAASNTQKALNVSTSGANGTASQTTYGGYFSNTHTGTTSTNYGMYSAATSGTTNIALKAGSTGGTDTYDLYAGIGTAAVGTNSHTGAYIDARNFYASTTTIKGINVQAGVQNFSSGATTVTGIQVDAGAYNNGGTVATAYGIDASLGAYNSASITTGSIIRAYAADSGAATYGTLYGLNMSNWSTLSATTTYGIYMDTSIDQGATRYALYSSSTSNSYMAGSLGLNTTGPDRKLDVLDASNPQIRLTTTDGTVYGDMQNTANTNVIVNGSTLSASTAIVQSGLQIAPTFNQTSLASYSGLVVNVTDSGSATGLKKLADLQLGGAPRFSVRNDGTLTLQDSANIVTPFGGYGTYTNLLVRSEEFDNASWTKASVTAPTADAQVAPDASSTAESLATSGSGGDVCQYTGTSAGSNTFTFSVWVKAATGTQSFGLRLDASATNCAAANTPAGTEQTFTATTNWQRYEITKTYSGATGNVKVRIFPGTSSGTGTVYAWGAQLDQASKASNYVFTAGSALTSLNSGSTIESNVPATASSSFTYGSRQIMKIQTTSNIDSTYIANFIRVYDNTCGTACDNTTKGMEIQAYSGTNLAGTNIGLDAYGYTFGVKGTTTGQASNVAQPAAIFADLDNGSAATTGNAIRAYTDNATSANMVSIYQETSAYTGTGILLNFGNGTGSFASGNFIDAQTAGVSKFKVASTGVTSVNLSNTATTFGLCHSGADVNAGTDTQRDIVACNGAPSDIAEWYETKPGVEAGDVVSITNDTFTYNEKDVSAFTGSETGTTSTHTISVLDKSQGAYDARLFGVVSTSPYQTFGTSIKDGGASNPQPIALKGRVLVKTTTENGVIQPGDYITSSATQPGKAMKATHPGFVIGQAISTADANGKVMTFIQPIYYDPGMSVASDGSVQLQRGSASSQLIANTADTAAQVMNQQGSGAILQLQQNGMDKFLVNNDGSVNINVTPASDVDLVLDVKAGLNSVFTINAKGTATFGGVIVIKDDTFAGSIATDDTGTAEVTFSYNLGTGKPVVMLTAEAIIPVFAQIAEFKQDAEGNYTGVVIKTFDLVSGPIKAIVHFNVIGKQDGYITQGALTVSDAPLSNNTPNLIIENGTVVGSADGSTPSDGFTPITPSDITSTPPADPTPVDTTGTVAGDTTTTP